MNSMVLSTIKAHSGLNQKKMAELLGISESKLSAVMNGNQTLSADSCGKLIHTFNLNPNWFFGYEGDPGKIEFMDDMVPRSQYEKVLQERQSMADELLELYRQKKTDE